MRVLLDNDSPKSSLKKMTSAAIPMIEPLCVMAIQIMHP
jgi:hypothetical protein